MPVLVLDYLYIKKFSQEFVGKIELKRGSGREIEGGRGEER